MRTQEAAVVIRCKTPNCQTEFDTGKRLPAFSADRPYRVLVKSIWPDPGELLCPVCKQTHRYGTEDYIEVPV